MTNDLKILTSDEVRALRVCPNCAEELEPSQGKDGQQRQYVRADGVVVKQWACACGQKVWLPDQLVVEAQTT